MTHGTDKWLSRLVYNTEGVLYEDAQLQVGVKSEFHGHQGRVQIYFGNKLPVALESFTATVEVDDADVDKVNVTVPKIASPHVSALSQIQQLVHVECRAAFAHAPLLHVSYLAGSLQTITLRLPVWVTKFIEPVKLDAGAFFERWKQIGGPPREAQQIFKISVDAPASGGGGGGGRVDVAKQQRVVGGVKMGLLTGVDPNPTNTVAAGVLHTSTGKVGCLLRMEPNEKARVSPAPSAPTEKIVLSADAELREMRTGEPVVSIDGAKYERSRVEGSARCSRTSARSSVVSEHGASCKFAKLYALRQFPPPPFASVLYNLRTVFEMTRVVTERVDPS